MERLVSCSCYHLSFILLLHLANLCSTDWSLLTVQQCLFRHGFRSTVSAALHVVDSATAAHAHTSADCLLLMDIAVLWPPGRCASAQ